jgi:hypothetical protein
MVGTLTAVAAYSQTPAPAPATPPPAYGKLVVTGLFDGYYQYTFSKGNSTYSTAALAPGNTNLLATGAGAAYTTNQTSPTLSLAEANLTILPAPGGFGGKATLGAGPTAEANGGGPYGAGYDTRYQSIMQLYGTYAFAGGGTIDFGKFYTPFGYEVTESNANFNYTRSTVYNLAPFYETGFRLTSPTFAKGFTVAAQVVQALFDDAYEGVSDKSGTPAVIGQVTYADPAGKFTIVETYGGGKNKPADTDITSTESDTDFTLNLGANDVIGAEYLYLSMKESGVPSTSANGWAGYYRHQLNAKDAVALRYSGYEAKAGGTAAGPVLATGIAADVAPGAPAIPSTDFKPYDITATFEVKASPQWLTRLEYRYDGANTAIYADSSGNVNKKDQSSVIASEVFTF